MSTKTNNCLFQGGLILAALLFITLMVQCCNKPSVAQSTNPETYRVDGCQYLWFSNGEVVHKGNCDNHLGGN